MNRSASRVTKPIPPLRDGDRLTADEFLRRYEADSTVARAELIQGVVYINARRVVVDGQERTMPPISGGHAVPQSRFLGLFTVYSAHTNGVTAYGPVTMKLSSGFLPEPDSLLAISPECGGHSRLDLDEYIDGPPELVAEIATSSAAQDLGPKFDSYLAEGISEYIVWRTAHKQIDWFIRKRKKYVPLEPDAEGVIRSETFPGLWLNVPAVLTGDMLTALNTLALGLKSPEHTAFVAKLQATAKRKKRS